MIITKRRPASRSQEVVEYDNGRIARLCYAPHNPHYFKNRKGKLKKIELYPDNIRTKFNMALWDKNVVSMGLKRTGDPSKYIGYRPDTMQEEGTEQLEFTLLSVKLDGENQEIELGEPSRIHTGIQSVGQQVYVTNTRQSSRQCWKVERPIKDFEIRYKLNVKGMIIKPHKGEFWFYSIKTGEFRFRIKKPSILDDRFKTIQTEGMTHTLVKESGELIYKKKNLQPIDIKKDIYYIDAETCYSSTEDGYIYCGGLASGNTWAEARDGTADNLESTSGGENFWVRGSYSLSTGFYWWWVYRAFLMFDTSSIYTEHISDASLFVETTSTSFSNPVVVSAQQGTQGGTLTTADFNAFSGNSFGTVNCQKESTWYEIVFNDDGKNAIEVDGITYICCREHTHDYVNSQPDDENVGFFYSTDATGVENDPYLSIQMGWSHKIFGTSMFRSIMGIPRENIQSVMGIPRS